MDTKKIVKIVVGAAMLFLAYQFFFGSGMFNGFFSSSVDDGKLGAGSADFMSQALEIAATVLAAIGGFGIASATKLIAWLSGAFPGDDQVETSTTNSSLDKALANFLIQSAIDGDRQMTVIMAEKIHGTPYIDQGAK